MQTASAMRAIARGLAALAAALAVACGPSSPKPPQPPPTETTTKQPPVFTGSGAPIPGAPVATAQIDPAGGILRSADGNVAVAFPPGAVAQSTQYSIQAVTSLALGSVGHTYRIQPGGHTLSAPVTLTFQGPASYAAGTSIDGLGIVYQDENGWWHAVDGVVRDPISNTLSVASDHFSDWGVTWQAGVPGMYGPYTVTQNLDVSFSVKGTATLFYQGANAVKTLYILTGADATLQPAITSGTATCSPVTAANMPLTPSVAEIMNSPSQFRWSVNDYWDITCSAAPQFISTTFDTLGVNLVGCARSYVGTPLIGADHLQGTYTIDCGTKGNVTATWDFIQCVPGVACQPANLCRTGAIDCTTGIPACIENGNVANGTTCGTNMVCNTGACVACVANASCSTNPNQCVLGTTSCATGTQVCVDTTTPVPSMGTTCAIAGSCYQDTIQCVANQPTCAETATPLSAGTSCGTNLVCNGAGACNACTAGLACSTNPNQCVLGTTSCATGAQTCVDTATPVASLGTSCAIPGSCYQDAIQCVASQPTCAATTTPLGAGTSCGANAVCDGAGVCNACTVGLACSTNPNQCVQGVTSCATGTQTCVDTVTPVASLGTACAIPGSCYQDTVTCVANNPVCTATTTPLPAGTSCGTNMVCTGAGVCNACTAGLACSTNPNQCVQGTTSCATGFQTCIDTTTPVASIGMACVIAGNCFQDTVTCVASNPTCTATATPLAAGTSCGTNMVCSPTQTCIACTAGLACSTNPNQCVLGTTSCATGAQTCVDTATNVPSIGTACVIAGNCYQDTVTCVANNPTCTATTTPLAPGTSCGTNMVCSPTQTCIACTAGTACSTNPNPCVAGATSCATGAQTCADTTTNIAAGTSCGTNLVCNGTGACVSCTAGTACSTNPNKCVAGITSCATGAQTCVDTTTNVAAGTSCGTNLVCNGTGACVSCTAGTACSTNPNQCVLGTTSCATGAQTCVDTTTNVPSIGTACVIAGDCYQDTVTCVASNPTCTATTTPLSAGTSCGTNMVCNGLGVCNACTAGLSCTTQPDLLCHLGVTDCSTGASTCVNGTALANGTSCAVGQTCNAGTCVPSRTVTGARLVNYWPDVGAPLAGVPAPDVNTPPLATVAALVPNGGGWITYTGSFTASGTFSIPNVPTGTYVLSLVDGSGVQTLVETSSSTVDLGYDVLGRPDVARPSASTPVTFSLSGLAAWNQGGDQVQIESSNADVWDVPASGAGIAAGATGSPTPVSVVEDWFASSSGGPMNLLAAADVLWVHDLATLNATRAVALTTHPYQAVANATSVTGTALSSGTPATIAAALAPALQTGQVTGSSTVAVDWRLSQFEAQLAGIIGTAVAPAGSQHVLAVGANAYPLANPAPVADGSPILFQMHLAAGTGDFATTAALAYGQFLPAPWNEWRGVEFSAPVTYLAPTATVGVADYGLVGRREPMSPAVPTPIVPTLGAVQSPVINTTLVAFASNVGVTTTPTISWTAPALGIATSYVVDVFSLTAKPGTPVTTVASLVGRWHTASTSVVVPPSLLATGGLYYARITAYANAPDPFATTPLRYGNVFTYATTVTGTFSP